MEKRLSTKEKSKKLKVISKAKPNNKKVYEAMLEARENNLLLELSSMSESVEESSRRLLTFISKAERTFTPIVKPLGYDDPFFKRLKTALCLIFGINI